MTLKKGLKLAKIAGLIDTVATVQLCRPPLSDTTSSNSSILRTQACQLPFSNNRGMNGVTDVDVAKLQVTDRGVANKARAVNQNVLDNFHAEYGFKLSPQLNDAQCYAQTAYYFYRYVTSL